MALMAVPAFVGRTVSRLVVGAGLLAIAIWVAGWTVERGQFGSDPVASRARLEAEIRTQFALLGQRLDLAVRSVTATAETVRASERADAAATRALFDQVAASADVAGTGGPIAVTIYGSHQQPVAWTGDAVDVPGDRLAGPAALFLAPSAQGLQLVRVQPLTEAENPRRHGSAVVAELPLSRAAPGAAVSTFALETSLGSVTLRPQFEGAADAGPEAFLLRSPSGDPLAAITIPTGALVAARERIRDLRSATELALLAALALLLCGPLLDWRRGVRSLAAGTALALTVAALLIGARAVLWIAVRRADLATPSLTTTGSWAALPALMLASPVDFLLTSLLALGLVGLAHSAYSGWRTAHRPGLGVLAIDRPSIAALFGITQVAAGAVVTLVVVGYESFLRTHVSQAPVDMLRFALGPWDALRLQVVVGLTMLNAALVAGSVLVLRGAASPWVFPVAPSLWRLRAVLAWTAPALLLVLPGVRLHAPPGPSAVVVAFIAAAAWATNRYRATFRHSSQAARLVTLLVALVVPSIVLYPSLVDAAKRARQQLVETRYAPEVTQQRRDLQVRLREALVEIDRIEGLANLIRASDLHDSGPPSTDAAFLVWSQTGLARQRLTSSVELHNATGAMVSRFALKLPDTPQSWVEASCDWEILEEVNPFFAEERRLLHAGRGVCEPGTRRLVGSLIVHVMLDYGNLSFVSAQNPYVALLRSGRPLPEPRLRADVNFTVYGWSRRVLYTSSQTAPALPDAVYRLAYASRAPFWTTITRGESSVDAYVLNDRGAIYVLGVARQTAFDHLVTVAELITLGFTLFVGLVLAGMLFGLVSARPPASGRALLDEVRASFYRKLFLAFVAAAIVPVLAMAFVSRAYVASLMLADIESEATRTAGLASRVIEDFGSVQARGLATLPVVDDNLVVWLSRVIAQDVNIFDGASLLASSERNLFASGLLSTRTPGAAYRAILLDGRPSFVGRDTAGGLEYLVAVAPVRVQDRDAVMTVPLASRQQETESQIEQLDRRVVLAAMLFIMLGSGIGYYMAERIADPVNRLMRATRRIARGDLDARVLATSSDELRRLVDAFNGMAGDLQRQRRELERTNRLQAWADMARQVAHDIKNPLTPIQLSAEHLRRVHADRGLPMGPVVDECVGNILGQVRLLRQISAEFSSFASSPTPRPVEASLADLVHEVVEPYRVGLAGRVSVVVTVAPALPSVWVDRLLMARALTNVVENALHAMPGGGTLTVTADLESDGRVALSVVDTGVGMDDEALARIFEPYFSTKATGTGLGLTIAKRNTEASGGTIHVASKPGRGTTVTMILEAVAGERK